MKKKLLTLAVCTVIASANAQTVFNFDNGAAVSNTNLVNITVSDVSKENENGAIPLRDNADASNVSGSSSGFYAQASAKDVSINPFLSTYFEVTFTPTGSNSVTYAAISFNAKVSGDGPTNWTLRSSADGYSSDLATGTLSTTTWIHESYSGTPLVGMGGAPVSFRLYAFNFSNSPTTSTSTWKIDDLTFHSDISTLPISLEAFYAKEVNEEVLLNWTTSSEKNNDHFNILRSSNGKDFKTVGLVKGGGTSDNELSYSFVDNNPSAGTNYYQLQQTDFDGKSQSSNIIAIKTHISASTISVYLSNSMVNLNINSANEGAAKLYLFDVMGRKIGEKNAFLSKGNNSLEFQESLSPGIHFVRLISDSEVISQKFMR